MPLHVFSKYIKEKLFIDLNQQHPIRLMEIHVQ